MIDYDHAINRMEFTAAASSAPVFSLTSNTAEFGTDIAKISGSATSTGSFGRIDVAGKLFVGGSQVGAGGGGSADNLGNHTATQDLDLNSNSIKNVIHITGSGNISGSVTSTGSFGSVLSTGNVSIGTSTLGGDQAAKLYIFEDDSSFGNTGIHIENGKADDAAVIVLEGARTSTNDSSQIVFRNSGDNVARIAAFSGHGSNNDSGEIQFSVSEDGTASSITTAMTIDTTGNVGIGTTTPDTNLHIHKASAGSISGHTDAQLVVENSAATSINLLSGTTAHGQIQFGCSEDADRGVVGYDQSDDRMYILTNGSTTKRFSVESDGDIGINTTNPSQQLAGANRVVQIKGELVLEDGAGNSTFLALGGAQNAKNYVASTGAIPLHIRTNNTDAIVIDASQNVEFGGDVSGSSTSTGSFAMVHGANSLLLGTTTKQAGFDNQIIVEGPNPVLMLKDNTGGNQATQFHTVFSSNGAIKQYFDHEKSFSIAHTTDVIGNNENVMMKIDGSNVEFPYANTKISGSSTSTGSFGRLEIADNAQFGTANGDIQIGGGAGLNITHNNSGLTVVTLNHVYGATNAGAQMKLQSGFLTFHTGTSNTERVRIDASGNFGIGTTPVATHTNFRNLTLGGLTTLTSNSGTSAGGFLALNHNSHIDTDDSWEYIVTDEASMYQQLNGEHRFYTAGSGTAGNDISWSERLRINNSGNVGIGTTSPSNKLTVEDTIGIKRSGVAAITTLQMTGAGLTVNGASGYHPLIIQGNGTEFARVNSSGNVGIGTATPGHKLHVVGDIRATGDIIANRLVVSSSVSHITASFSSGSTIFGDTQDDVHQFTGSLNVTGSEVNITAQSPIINLHDTNVSNLKHRILGGGNAGLEFSADINNAGTGYIRFDVANSEKVRILENGNVGIGDATPSYPLDVAGIIASTDAVGVFRLVGTTNGRTYDLKSNGGRFEIRDSDNGQDRLIVGTNGNIGIGDGLLTPGAKLTVDGDISGSSTSTGSFGALSINNGGELIAAGYNVSINGHITGSSMSLGDGITLRGGVFSIYKGANVNQIRHDNNNELEFRNANTAHKQLTIADTKVSGSSITTGSFGALSVPGQATIGSVVEASSIAYKENVRQIESPLEKITKLRGVEFDYKKTKEHSIGMIAEEVNEIFPELVAKNEDGDVTAMSYTRITAVLLEAVKELSDEVKELRKLNNYSKSGDKK
tara:strand:- start:1053 stop:4655 length:3603 start_codon:yes stop_codon:yes gene_type:complete